MNKYSFFMAFLLFMQSCDNDISDGSVQFPVLNNQPEIEVYKQTKSLKRGVCTSFRLTDMFELLGGGISWCYNWSHSPLSDDIYTSLHAADITYIPMVWNASYNLDYLSDHMDNNGDSKYILGYNEPNLTDQANMTPSEALETWDDLVVQAQNLGAKLVAPALNYGTLTDYGDPIDWYDEFFESTSIDNVDALALHSYMGSASSVKSYMERFSKYDKPIWLTEFASWESYTSLESQNTFLSNVCLYLELEPMIEKYAWFMDITSNYSNPYPYINLMGYDEEFKLTDLGLLYVGHSTLDKETYYDIDENIPAEHYSNHYMSESLSSATWEPGCLTRVTTDYYESLELCYIRTGTWVEYLIDIPLDGTYRIDLRYAGGLNSEIMLTPSNSTPLSISLPKTGDETIWDTLGSSIELAAGKQTLRLESTKGLFCLNWLRISSKQ